METLFPVFRKILVLGIWIYVGYQMLPAARSTNRNGFLWYVIGLLSFYIPFSLIGFIPAMLILIAMKNGFDIPSWVFDTVGVVAFFGAVFMGLACLQRAKMAAMVVRKC